MMKHTDDFKREAMRIALSSCLSRRRVSSDSGGVLDISDDRNGT